MSSVGLAAASCWKRQRQSGMPSSRPRADPAVSFPAAIEKAEVASVRVGELGTERRAYDQEIDEAGRRSAASWRGLRPIVSWKRRREL